MEELILVDAQDREVGRCEKLEAHRRGVLHRAFSVFLFDRKGRLLVQRRDLGKYHSGGLWANTACGHPRPEEGVVEAGERRLFEEMGVRCGLKEHRSLIYRAELDNGLVEHELVHWLAAFWEGEPNPNPDEVCEWAWVDVEKADLEWAAWFQIYLDQYPADFSSMRDATLAAHSG